MESNAAQPDLTSIPGPLPIDRNRKAACPECGKVLSPRGLAGHMRLKHGLQLTPKPPLPQNPGVDTEAIVGALLRIESKLAEIEARLDLNSETERHGLTEELRTTLASIENFREGPSNEDAIAQAARFRRLGLLRRRQAELLYELGSGLVTPDELLAIDRPR